MNAPVPSYANEHPLDVLSFLGMCATRSLPCALVMLTRTQGGAVRAPGALMAVTQTGQTHGYLSGGCIDADVAHHACAALETGQIKKLRYGKGSPFLDIILPCGGAIELTVFPNPDMAKIEAAIETLKARQPAMLKLDPSTNGFTAQYRPKLRLRIAGRSADPLALARVSLAAGIETTLWSQDTACLQAASAIKGLHTETLSSPASLPETQDDAATAFVLMMHDHDWEPALLRQALTGDAFYIGAVGSPHTHAKRAELLNSSGLDADQIARIKGPIGLVPSLRDASMLAVSTLAEIIEAFHNQNARQVPSREKVSLNA